MKTRSHLSLTFLALLVFGFSYAQEKVFPGADDSTHSKAQYFSWINNTNEGTTEEHTLINLQFFEWLQKRIRNAVRYLCI